MEKILEIRINNKTGKISVHKAKDKTIGSPTDTTWIGATNVTCPYGYSFTHCYEKNLAKAKRKFASYHYKKLVKDYALIDKKMRKLIDFIR